MKSITLQDDPPPRYSAEGLPDAAVAAARSRPSLLDSFGSLLELQGACVEIVAAYSGIVEVFLLDFASLTGGSTDLSELQDTVVHL